MASPVLSIFVRYPEPGKAKTRLIPALGAEGAALLYRRLVAHTVAVARESGLDFELRITGAGPAVFADWLGEGLAFSEQGEGELGERLARVPAPAIIIGSDAPGLSAMHLRQAAEIVGEGRVAIGPASDGGYYLIGLPRPMPFLFGDMRWSTPEVFPETVSRLSARSEPHSLLAELTDIDEPADLAAFPADE